VSRLDIKPHKHDERDYREEDIMRRKIFVEGMARFKDTEPQAFSALMDYWDAEVRGNMSKVLSEMTPDEDVVKIRHKLLGQAELINLIDAQLSLYERQEWLAEQAKEREVDKKKWEFARHQMSNQQENVRNV